MRRQSCVGDGEAGGDEVGGILWEAGAPEHRRIVIQEIWGIVKMSIGIYLHVFNLITGGPLPRPLVSE